MPIDRGGVVAGELQGEAAAGNSTFLNPSYAQLSPVNTARSNPDNAMRFAPAGGAAAPAPALYGRSTGSNDTANDLHAQADVEGSNTRVAGADFATGGVRAEAPVRQAVDVQPAQDVQSDVRTGQGRTGPLNAYMVAQPVQQEPARQTVLNNDGRAMQVQAPIDAASYALNKPVAPSTNDLQQDAPANNLQQDAPANNMQQDAPANNMQQDAPANNFASNFLRPPLENLPRPDAGVKGNVG